MLEQIS